MNKKDKETLTGVLIISGLLVFVALVDMPVWVWLGLMGIAIVVFLAIIRDIEVKIRKLFPK